MRSRGPRAWVARWQAALRIARRDATRNLRRTLLIVTMIGVPIAAIVFLVSLVLSSTGTPLTRLTAEIGPSAQAIVTDAGCGGCLYYQTPDRSSAGSDETPPDATDPTRERVAEVLGRPLGEIAPLWEGQVAVSAGDLNAGISAVRAMSVDAIGQVYTAREGRLPQQSGEVAVDPGLANRLHLELGDTVQAEGVDLGVVGVLDGRNLPSVSTLTTEGSLDLGSARTWFVLGAEPVTWDDVVALNAIGTTVASREVTIDPPDRSEVPIYQKWDVTNPGTSAATVGVMGAVGAIALIEAVLLIGPAFAVGARRQTRQLALVAANGGSGRDLKRIVLASGVVAGLAAGVIGAAAGVLALAVVWAISRLGTGTLPAFIVPWWLPIAVIAFAVLLGCLAVWMPARSAARRDTVAALGGRRSDALPARHTPWIGLVLGAVGLGVALFGVLRNQPILLVAGIVGLEVGVVLSTGGLLVLAARVAPRLDVAGRFALRDAVRQRARTVPAVASVIAAVAAAVAAGMYTATDDGVLRASWQPDFGPGVMLVRTPEPFVDGAYVADPDALPALVEEASERIAAVVPIADQALASVLVSTDPTLVAESALPQVRPDQECPLPDSPTDADWAQYEDDPRCQGQVWQSQLWVNGWSGVVVDDGTATRVMGFGDDGERAAEALASGRIVVGADKYVWDDGTAHVQVLLYNPDDPQAEARTIELVAPAYVQRWNTGTTILPSSLVATTDGLDTMVGAALFTTTEPFDPSWADRVQGELSGAGNLEVIQPFRSSVGVVTLALVGVAALVALAATWLSVGLAAAETRPDLATLAAVGAGPKVRRRVAAAQAAVIAVLGVGVGVVLGLALGWVLARWALQNGQEYVDLTGRGIVLGVEVPWLAVAVVAFVLPALALAGAWLTAPRNLPLARRLAQ